MRFRTARNSWENRVRMVVFLLSSERIACVSVLRDRGRKSPGGWKVVPTGEWVLVIFQGSDLRSSSTLEVLVWESDEVRPRGLCQEPLREAFFTCVCLRSPERCTNIVLLLYISSSCPFLSPRLPLLRSDWIGRRSEFSV